MRSSKFERGQALAELAIVLPIVLYLAVGSADFARGLTQYIQVVNAANAAAQYGSLGPTNSADTTGIKAVANDDLSGVSSPSVSVSTGDDGTTETANKVTVTVSTVFHPMTPIVGLFASSISISHTTVMRVNPTGS